jgi:hypothetical protein
LNVFSSVSIASASGEPQRLGFSAHELVRIGVSQSAGLCVFVLGKPAVFGGAMDRILRVDMSTLTAKEEPYPDQWAALGGRALSAKILLKEVDPKCDPLGASSKLIFAPGCLSGAAAPTSGRMSVGAKSPLTGGIKEANAGGQAAQKLMRLGYRAVIERRQDAGVHDHRTHSDPRGRLRRAPGCVAPRVQPDPVQGGLADVPGRKLSRSFAVDVSYVRSALVAE